MSLEMTQRVLGDESLSRPVDKLVMLVLAYHYNPKHGCFPSVPTIARESSITKRCVYGAIKRLEVSRKISKIRGNNMRPGRGHSNRYTLYPQMDERERVNEVHPLAAEERVNEMHERVNDVHKKGEPRSQKGESDSTLIVSNSKRNEMKLTDCTAGARSAAAGGGSLPDQTKQADSSGNQADTSGKQADSSGSSNADAFSEADKWIAAHPADIERLKQAFADRGFDVLKAIRKCIEYNVEQGADLSEITPVTVRGWLKRQKPDRKQKQHTPETADRGKNKRKSGEEHSASDDDEYESEEEIEARKKRSREKIEKLYNDWRDKLRLLPPMSLDGVMQYLTSNGVGFGDANDITKRAALLGDQWRNSESVLVPEGKLYRGIDYKEPEQEREAMQEQQRRERERLEQERDHRLTEEAQKLADLPCNWDSDSLSDGIYVNCGCRDEFSKNELIERGEELGLVVEGTCGPIGKNTQERLAREEAAT